MKNNILYPIFGILVLISITGVYAEISYPIPELENCNSQQECEAYCDNVEHIEVCITVAEKYGLMTAEEIADAKRVIPFLKAGTTPGQCKSRSECDAYCNKEENLNECIDFAIKIGDIDEKEAEMIKKTGGKGPGGCKGKEECDVFCGKEENFATCVDFAVQNGMISPEDAEIVKKTGGKGPGDCKNKEECDAFCNNPDNQETCTNFAIENNLLSEEELERMKKNQEFTNSAEGKCYSQCLKDNSISFKDCPEGGEGPESCKSCQDKCFPHDNFGNCLSQEKWQQLDADCKAKGSGYHLEEVKGSNGQGGECVVDETCVYSSGEEWESQEEKDKKLAEMQKQWDEERARYEAEQRGSTESSSGSDGGCTQPGPEGQCNPGPGAGEITPGGDSGTGDSGSGDSGSSGGDSGTGDETSGDTSGSDSGSSDSGSSGDTSGGSSDSGSSASSSSDSAPVTGGVIVKINPMFKMKLL